MTSMDKWGVTLAGFYRPTVDDIINERNKKAKEIFGEDFDTSELTPQGKLFRLNASSESKLCEIAEQVYYSIFPTTARGVSLDRVCKFANLTRDSAGFASHMIRAYGVQGYVIPAGTLFKNAGGVTFYNTVDVTIENEEQGQEEIVYYVDFVVTCTESGTIGNVQNINSTVEVDTNITSIEWQNGFASGTDTESDPDLRDKFSRVIQGMGTNTKSSIIANVLRVSGVNDADIIDNTTSEAVQIGDLTLEPRSYAVIVYADGVGIDDDIAQAIFEKQPLGVVQSGNVAVVITDNSGVQHNVAFTYVTPQKIDISATCTFNSDFSGNISDLTDSLTNYINTLEIGENVVYTRLYKCLYDITGVDCVTALTINDGTNDIEISDIQIAKAGIVTVSE